MTIDIFIRTYHKDFPWLAYALKSIHKNVIGFRNIIVAAPDTTGIRHLTKEMVVEVPDLPNGYIGQQLTKMEAWKFTDADYIMYWDSDCIATRPFDVKEFFHRNASLIERPILVITPYASLSGDVLKWREITKKATGIDCEWECMRRLPLVYRRDTVQAAQEHIEQFQGKRLRDYLAGVEGNEFSEFNAIGAYMLRGDGEVTGYAFTETAPYNPVKQYWSWHGIDKPLHNGKTQRQEIEEILA